MVRRWGAAIAVLVLLTGCDNPFQDDGPAAAKPAPTVTVTVSPGGEESPAPSPTPTEDAVDPLASTKAKVQALEEVPSEEASEQSTLPSSNLVAGRPGTFTTMDDFLTTVLQDIDAYWSAIFEASGLPAPQVIYAWPEAGARLPSACEPFFTDDNTAAYCPADDRIVVSQPLALAVWKGQVRANADPDDGQASGDFSVAYVVAHEYAHSLQGELGILARSGLPVMKIELHADCWSGVWAFSAYERGELDPGDIEEALKTATLVGDYATDNPQHHGTPAERVEAFVTGFRSGDPGGCDGYLN